MWILQIRLGKYTNYSHYKNCVIRACIESLRACEKFEISERKVNFYRVKVCVPDVEIRRS